ncbi:MAG TPA: uracil-DNA glycosylase [Deltaproteobacteria bacterium]|nr:uracil-DNA glycosylase [Deltaproteobacteria bacterium]HDM32408.1 uracil-DNA glycosylase [Deltaproteobacteria bacterium]
MPPVGTTDAKIPSLESIRAELGDCRRCPLWRTRNHIVFGEGNPRAKIMFIGEAPGAMEDRTGRPFVGKAGGLLTDIIEKGMGMKRSDVYIANILKCRPPGNRDPLPSEVEKCIGFLHEQINVVRPDIIIALGRVATQNLLETSTPISKLRGRFHDFMGIKLMPTYHPSYLLQNPSKKRDVWEDIKKVLKEMGLSVQR